MFTAHYIYYTFCTLHAIAYGHDAVISRPTFGFGFWGWSYCKRIRTSQFAVIAALGHPLPRYRLSSPVGQRTLHALRQKLNLLEQIAESQFQWRLRERWP